MSQQINLFNPIFMKQRKYFSLLTMLQALGMIIAGSLIFYGYAIYQVGQLKQQSEENTKRYNCRAGASGSALWRSFLRSNPINYCRMRCSDWKSRSPNRTKLSRR